MNIVRWALVVFGFAGLYALFAGTLSGSEAAAGAVCVVVAVMYAWLAQRAEARRFRFRPGWVRVLPKLGLALGRETVLVGYALMTSMFRPVEGSLVRQPFEHGGNAGAAGARRALVTLGVSMAPNGYVVRMPAQGEFLLVHRLAPASPPTDMAWPV